MCTDVNPVTPSAAGSSAAFSAHPAAWQRLAATSAEVIARAQHASGGIPAAVTFAPYGFCWFRDGAFIADGMSAAGRQDVATRFHRWCAGVLLRERDAVDRAVAASEAGTTLPDSEYLPARYSLDGTRHDDDWWNFQVDGYGTWLWVLERFLRRSGEPPDAYADAVETATRYLVATGRAACRDWWEEHRDQRHVNTLAGVYAGLRAAVRLCVLEPDLAAAAGRAAEGALADVRERGTRDGHLVKWLDGSTEVDGSLVSVAALYDMLPVNDPVVVATVAAVEDRLTTAPDSGVHRYPSDTFFGGGQWPVLTCLLAWHHGRAGDLDRAARLLDSVVGTADDEGQLPEQVPPLLAPARLEEWLRRWGPSARPLLWSHGMFLATLEAFEQAGARSR